MADDVYQVKFEANLEARDTNLNCVWIGKIAGR